MDIQAKLEKYRKEKEKEKLLANKAKLSFPERYFPAFVSSWFIRKGLSSSENSESTSTEPEAVLTPVPPLEAQENFLNEKKLRAQLRKRGKFAMDQPIENDIPFSKDEIDSVEVDSDTETIPWTKLDWLILALKLVLWINLLKLFIHLEFAAVFVALSMFYLMLTNFRKDRRKPWEPSAYSVFNPNCEAIEGAITPEQFERELRYGAL